MGPERFHDGEPMYCDRSGQPITMEEWSNLLLDHENVIVKKTIVGHAEVSTVWLGLNHNYWSGPPLIFETMIFRVNVTPHNIFGRVELLHDDLWDYQERYATEEAALAGHDRAIAYAKEAQSIAPH